MLEQPSTPMIIAVEGHSRSSTGSEVAAKLSNYLKYSLINPDDIGPVLRNFLPSSSNQALSATSSEDLDNISFKIIYQIASVQLRSKLGVVINLTALSSVDQFDQLKQLANSQGVELILIGCRSADEIVEEGSALPDAGVGVRKLTVDADQPFDVETYVSENLPQVFPKVPESQIPEGSPVKTSSIGPSRQKQENTYKHLHKLTLDSKPRNEAATDCKCCTKPVSGPNYQCVACEEYIFHKACAELTGDLGKIGENYPGLRKPREVELNHFTGRGCKTCQQNFSDDCHDCLLEANLEKKILPIVLKHETHSHTLNLIIVPRSYNYEFLCCGCGEFGKSISYRCYDCNFNLHVGCLLLPQVINKTTHHMHPLSLVYDSLGTSFWDKDYPCDRCAKKTDPRHWFYYCASCAFVIHVGCAFQTNW